MGTGNVTRQPIEWTDKKVDRRTEGVRKPIGKPAQDTGEQAEQPVGVGQRVTIARDNYRGGAKLTIKVVGVGKVYVDMDQTALMELAKMAMGAPYDSAILSAMVSSFTPVKE